MVLATLLSALLYRIPRGGLWGTYEIKSSIGAAIWSIGSACMIGWVLEAPYWSWAFVAAFLTVAERPGWSTWWPNNTTASMWKLSLRGALLLNPLMGPIYFLAYKYRDRYKMGWTELAELLSGYVTALGTIGLYFIVEIIYNAI